MCFTSANPNASLDLRAIKRLRRQRIIFDKPIAITPLTVDPGTGRSQTINVAIERAQRHARFPRQPRSSDRRRHDAHRLEKPKKSVGSSHHSTVGNWQLGSIISALSAHTNQELAMTVKAGTHLNFRGDARAALAFYQSVFGGDQMVISYKDAGNVQNAAEADQAR